MRELFDSFEKVGYERKGLVLLDTCFVFDLLDREKDLLKGYPYALSSFTVDELVHVGHKLHKMKKRLRRFLSSHDFMVVDTPVHPGDMKGEKAYVNSIDPHLLEHIADPSDAVLLAVALQTRAIVLTKDKHHLFTTDLVNYLNGKGVFVFKEMKDLL